MRIKSMRGIKIIILNDFTFNAAEYISTIAKNDDYNDGIVG